MMFSRTMSRPVMGALAHRARLQRTSVTDWIRATGPRVPCKAHDIAPLDLLGMARDQKSVVAIVWKDVVRGKRAPTRAT
jgi:hypothetical protein